MIKNEISRQMANRVHFDPTSKEHRKIVATYMSTRSWKHTNMRFHIEQPYSNVVALVTAKLAQYYAEQEFEGIHFIMDVATD